jgi:NAD(P)-dependent dehydrogenase (short-subunit alcohol dehydrogenase family)
VKGRTALVTGGRTKIGLRTALGLLRADAEMVVIITRFPHNAAEKYHEEPDFSRWKARLHIYGADFRHLAGVGELITHLQRHYRFSILINNAAQTVRRPPDYYRALAEREEDLFYARKGLILQPHARALIKNVGEDPHPAANQGVVAIYDVKLPREYQAQGVVGFGGSTTQLAKLLRVHRSLVPASLTQLALLQEDKLTDTQSSALFPRGAVDIHGDQLDLRANTSWSMGLTEVSPVEMLEVQLINNTVPFMLVQQLMGNKGLTTHKGSRGITTTDTREMRFVVNVSSPEGQFATRSTTKSGDHPHTNMAKAGLNMLTRTISSDFALEGIYVTSVDTGWVSRMQPKPGSFVPVLAPLSEDDGAARVLHPIAAALSPAVSATLKSLPVTSPFTQGAKEAKAQMEASSKKPEPSPGEFAPHFGVFLQHFAVSLW